MRHDAAPLNTRYTAPSRQPSTDVAPIEPGPLAEEQVPQRIAAPQHGLDATGRRELERRRALDARHRNPRALAEQQVRIREQQERIAEQRRADEVAARPAVDRLADDVAEVMPNATRSSGRSPA